MTVPPVSQPAALVGTDATEARHAGGGVPTDVVVAVDVMGTDRGPAEVVAGAIAARTELGLRTLLVGDAAIVEPLLVAAGCPEGVTFEHAPDVVAMADNPVAAVRGRPGASVVRCVEAVREGRAGAMVSAGNTGATMAAAVLRLRRLEGIERPAIATPVPAPGRRPLVLVDAGANVDCDPAWLVQWARMGVVLARVRHDIAEPRVGLLSNGEEATKGDSLRKAVFPLLAALPGFVGNVEGGDLVGDRADVVVTDGFTGNVALKALEGAAQAIVGIVKECLFATPETRAAADVILPEFLTTYLQHDPESTGGALLAGVDGVCVISHGSSTARAIRQAVGVAAQCAAAGIVEQLKATLRDAG
jgi:phosphate acyltransferase